MRAAVGGLIGVTSLGAGGALDLMISVAIGASFAAIFRYQSLGYAPTISSGVLYGLLVWIVGPLTLVPALAGRGPTWSLAEANAALPSLVGHVLYGALTGLSYYVLVTLYLRIRPEAREPEEVRETPTTRVVILGGGFGGVGAAQRLEQIFSRDARFEITLVSQSNYLLFTPMLAEVASSGLEPQHISAPVRAALPHTRFRRAEVEALDTVAQAVRIRISPSAPEEVLPYDHLVLAVGSVPNFYGLPGLEAHSFTLKTLQDATKTLREFGVSHEVHVLSAHRNPHALAAYVEKAERDGARVFIAAAGGAAHLGGVVAALTQRPVLAVPIGGTSFNGLDSLLSMVQMPGGVPVATFAVGKPGARNAALFAVQMLALSDAALAEKYGSFKRKLADDVTAKDAAVQKKLKES
jgi:phosphoribosylaminoimidazole carboxylase PurE protein